MIIVTGAAGFIGSNIIKGFNAAGYTNILAVDDLTNGKKCLNLSTLNFSDYQDYEDFIGHIKSDKMFFEPVEAVFHEGACSVTTEWDGRYMMRNNYEYSKHLLHYCMEKEVPFLYASSAAVYGASTVFREDDMGQQPLNVYGYSKWQFDRYVLPFLKIARSQIVGFRYFNVYGPHEQHKGSMASVAFHLMNQLQDNNEVRLFEGCHGYADGEQCRDFVCVDDVVKVNLWFWKNTGQSGIYNVGTGKARSFNAVAKTLIHLHGSGELHYIPFPEKLKEAYQSFTEADVGKLRAAGYRDDFTSLENGLKRYYSWRCLRKKDKKTCGSTAGLI